MNRLLSAALLLVPCGLPVAAHGPDYAALYEEATQSVVWIKNEVFEGAGVIITPDGYILTNAHVIHDGHEVLEQNFALLHNRSVMEAEVIGYDWHSDIALLKIDAEEPLPAAAIGDSSELKTGDAAFAIGHPRGHYYSLSTGVISSLERVLPGPNSEVVVGACSVPWIQTDVAINSGNSGGPLLNGDGEVIGIISWGDDLGDDSGLNFAVPINGAMFIQEWLRDEGRVPWGILGVYADYHSVTDVMNNDIQGFLVHQVNKGSGAEAAGILPGDVIIEYNDEIVVGGGFFRCVLEGREIPIKLIRDDEEIDLLVTLSATEEDGFLF